MIGRGGPNLVRGMLIFKDVLEALRIPYRIFAHDSSMSNVVGYVKDVDRWMKAGGREQVAASLGLAPRQDQKAGKQTASVGSTSSKSNKAKVG